MNTCLLIPAFIAFVVFATPACASLSYHGIETTINDDLSALTNLTFKFSEPESQLECRTTLPVSSFKTSGSFGPVTCDSRKDGADSLIICALSGITADKNTLHIDIESRGAVNYSYGRYHFEAGFASSIPSDSFFSLIKLPESATLADFPIERSYSPENGTTITDGKRIIVIWEGGSLEANRQLDFRVEYNLPPISGPVTRYILLAAGILILIIVSAAFIYTRRASKVNKGRVIASVLNADEKRVVDIIAAGGGGVLQKHIVRESGFSKAKVSRLVKSLGGRGIVKTEPVSGRENRVLLAGEGKAGDRKNGERENADESSTKEA